MAISLMLCWQMTRHARSTLTVSVSASKRLETPFILEIRTVTRNVVAEHFRKMAVTTVTLLYLYSLPLGLPSWCHLPFFSSVFFWFLLVFYKKKWCVASPFSLILLRGVHVG